jgi:hypothetical protein
MTISLWNTMPGAGAQAGWPLARPSAGMEFDDRVADPNSWCSPKHRSGTEAGELAVRGDAIAASSASLSFV